MKNDFPLLLKIHARNFFTKLKNDIEPMRITSKNQNIYIGLDTAMLKKNILIKSVKRIWHLNLHRCKFKE